MYDQSNRIGFIGLKPDSHWAATAHIPTLSSLSDHFEIVGVAYGNLASSQKAAWAFRIRHAFASASELVQSTDDLVVNTVKVPHLFELVFVTLYTGKHVYCEWPQGNGLEEARKLAQLADEKNVVAVAGMQARVAVEIQHIKKLITEGFVGKVLPTTLVVSGGQWRADFISEYAYLSHKNEQGWG
ncbi:Gfo/Idh/MocA family protein [Pseudomonas thivervalensis]|uniref:Gfo/Idh/MocA family protein n=1 Tax=Pseudomonas thivervalensis TaxID=86265 RepID=UPI00069F0E8B|nr:Gfo/Idh/MocA family oxidoreductase [Pseudomonas thivervalensis]